MLRAPLAFVVSTSLLWAPPPESTANEAPRVAERSPAPRESSYIVVRPQKPSRVRLGPAVFLMGSTPQEVESAIDLCSKEVWGNLCSKLTERFKAEGLAHKVKLSAYEIDRTEVTVSAYENCTRAGVCAPPTFARGDLRFDRSDYPVTHVRWEDGGRYCHFMGGRLPTEAEWEFAARGARRRVFPYGNMPNPRVCNQGSRSRDDTDDRDGYVYLAPVGALAGCTTPEGVLDLAGNAAEWVSDFYTIDESGFGYGGNDLEDPKGPVTGTFHVVRGGSYHDAPDALRGAARTFQTAARSEHVGFRCAYDASFTSSASRRP